MGPRDPDVEAVGNPDPAVHRPAAARVAARVRAQAAPARVPPAPSSGAAAGYRALREADQVLQGSAEVRRAIRALSLTPRNPHLDPEGFDRAVEEVLRVAQVAGWLEPEAAAPRERERERERKAMTPEEFRAHAERLVGPERAAKALGEVAE